MKLVAGIFSGIFAIATISSCDTANNAEAETDADGVQVETEVVGVDTVGAETTYDVRKREITEVDTVGATTEYDVEKEVVTKTVDIDTAVREVEGEARQEVDADGYEVVDEDVETETVTKDVEVDSK